MLLGVTLACATLRTPDDPIPTDRPATNTPTAEVESITPTPQATFTPQSLPFGG